MTITCHNFESFMAVVYECTAKGLRFAAYTESLTVVLSGGH